MKVVDETFLNQDKSQMRVYIKIYHKLSMVLSYQNLLDGQTSCNEPLAGGPAIFCLSKQGCNCFLSLQISALCGGFYFHRQSSQSKIESYVVFLVCSSNKLLLLHKILNDSNFELMGLCIVR